MSVNTCDWQLNCLLAETPAYQNRDNYGSGKKNLRFNMRVKFILGYLGDISDFLCNMQHIPSNVHSVLFRFVCCGSFFLFWLNSCDLFIRNVWVCFIDTCWWSGDPSRQSTNSHNVGLIIPEYSGFSTKALHYTILCNIYWKISIYRLSGVLWQPAVVNVFWTHAINST